MRLWHKDLIDILPSDQLIGQWRECSLIAKLLAVNGTPNHILVNKVLDYQKEHFATYCYEVLWWMINRGYSPSSATKMAMEDHIGLKLSPYIEHDLLFDGWHNDRYLYQCVSNLEEKFDCGGIPDFEWQLIENFMCERL